MNKPTPSPINTPLARPKKRSLPAQADLSHHHHHAGTPSMVHPHLLPSSPRLHLAAQPGIPPPSHPMGRGGLIQHPFHPQHNLGNGSFLPARFAASPFHHPPPFFSPFFPPAFQPPFSHHAQSAHSLGTSSPRPKKDSKRPYSFRQEKEPRTHSLVETPVLPRTIDDVPLMTLPGALGNAIEKETLVLDAIPVKVENIDLVESVNKCSDPVLAVEKEEGLNLNPVIADLKHEEVLDRDPGVDIVKREPASMPDPLVDWMTLPKSLSPEPPDLDINPCPTLTELNLGPAPDPISAALYRRKRLRELQKRKRELNLPELDLESRVWKYTHHPTANISVIDPSDLSLDKLYVCGPLPVKHEPFTESLYGCAQPDLPHVSLLTKRVLKPWIWRDTESCTPHMHILRAISKNPDAPESLDYVHFGKRYLDQVNHFLSAMFWNGIDVSEYLRYPDYAVVALYGRLVVGCALAAPDGYLAYIAVLPGWQGAGIANFMMYYLCQSLPRDVTLHVSANNPAMILYQKLGFKPEEFIVGFYDKYYPPDSDASKHALFIRLRK